MNRVLHYALGQWDVIGRRLYLSTYAAMSGVRHLSHRPNEAVPFGTAAEAVAARGNLELMVRWDDYTKTATVRAKKLEVVEITEATLVAVYPDGSGLATDYVRTAMEYLREEEESCAALRRFVQAHLAVLNGLGWRCSIRHDGPSVEIASAAMRGKYVKPVEVARLFPGAKWTRRKEDYPTEKRVIFDWVCEIDGVNVRLTGAEVVNITPMRVPGDGELVRVGSEVTA